MATPKKRINLPLSTKIVILDKIKDGSTYASIQSEYGVCRRTIEKWVKNETDLRSSNIQTDPSRKRRRDGKHVEIDKCVKEWFSAVRNQKQTVNGPELKAKAKEFAEKLNQTFSPSEGWLHRWKKRCDVTYRKAHGEKANADPEAAERWREDRLIDILASYDDSSIYNADETGLYYRATSDGSLCFKKEELAGSKKSLDRITVLVCANMSGTDKKKL